MDFGKRDRAFLTMERHQQKQWTLVVTVRRSFYKELLSFFVGVPVYLHLPMNGYRRVRVYNTGKDYELGLIDWLRYHGEPFDIKCANGAEYSYRYNEDGQGSLYWYTRETTPTAIPSWADQERNLAIHKTNQLLDM